MFCFNLSMVAYSEEFLKKTLEFWRARSPEPLTLEDARQIAENMGALYEFLAELDKKYG